MVYRSPYPEVAIPDASLTEVVFAGMRERPERVAFIDGATGATTTYGALLDAIESLAAGLHAAGLAPGDVVALCTPNCPEFAVVFLAVARLGGAVTTINPALTEGEMARQLADSGAVVAFTTFALEGRVRAAAAGRLRLVHTVERLDRAARPGERPPQVRIEAGAVVALPYSSGTTGTPKGVMLTHGNLVAMLAQMGPLDGTREGDVVLAVLPFFHIYGLAVIMLVGFQRGATLVVFPRFEMDPVLRAIERHRITRLPLVPPLILRLTQEPTLDAHDLSSVRVVMSGAAPLAPELATRLSARLHGCLVKQGYGMTELSPTGHMHPEDQGPPPPGTVGLLHPNSECRLVDPVSGRDVEPGEVGEIWYRGPQVMKGYLGRPDATAAMITDEGWLRTGDLGRIDSAGQLAVVDRLKELIKYMAFQVAPAELEAVLLEHPAVADVAVVPRPDPEAGEIPKAFVVRRRDSAVTEAELIDFVAGRVAGYKRVRALEFIDQIPKSPSGKILRRLLVERDRGTSGPS